MSNKPTDYTEALQNYLYSFALSETPVMRDLREATQAHEYAVMQICAEQGQLMRLLVRLSRAKKALEIGVFTGYSALCVATELPEDGQLIACDVSDEFTSIGKPYWNLGSVAHKIDLRIKPAMETLDELLVDESQHGTFDFFFIDADKTSYADYYEKCMILARPGALILIDNAFWSGRVVNAVNEDADTQALDSINRIVCADERVFASIIPIGDGLLLAHKKG